MRICRVAAAFGVWLAMAAAPAPPADQRNSLLEKARALALAYSRTLPDFLCTQTIHRSIRYQQNGVWAPVDTLTVQVTYSQQKESYKLLLDNGRATDRSYAAIAGATTVGEFGSTLRWIFDPASQAQFTWNDRPGPHHTSVLAYRVAAGNSRYELISGTQATFAGYHGTVDIDPQTARVLRATMVADLPEGFPIRKSSTTIVYGDVRLDGQEYFLPVHAEADAADVPHGQAAGNTPGTPVCCDWSRPFPVRPPGGAPALTGYRNQIDFRGYKRFTVDSRLIAQ